MKYVYILSSKRDPSKRYFGVTSDLKRRLNEHNHGNCTYTSQFGPWSLETYLAFSTESKAWQFEKYLKTRSGQAFSRKRL
jgi:putative endonuclease